MNLNAKFRTTFMQTGALLGLFIAVLGQSVYAADHESTQVNLVTDDNFVTTYRTFQGFEVEIQAPPTVDASLLLHDVPAIATAAATHASPKPSTEDTFQKILNTIEKAQKTRFPNEPISIIITRTGANINPQSTSGRVELYKAYLIENRSASAGQAIYVRDQIVNTMTCFERNRSGSWKRAYQNNGSWYLPSPVPYSKVGFMQATGYDNRKGCYWQGLKSYNRGDFVILMYN